MRKWDPQNVDLSLIRMSSWNLKTPIVWFPLIILNFLWGSFFGSSSFFACLGLRSWLESSVQSDQCSLLNPVNTDLDQLLVEGLAKTIMMHLSLSPEHYSSPTPPPPTHKQIKSYFICCYLHWFYFLFYTCVACNCCILQSFSPTCMYSVLMEAPCLESIIPYLMARMPSEKSEPSCNFSLNLESDIQAM